MFSVLGQHLTYFYYSLHWDWTIHRVSDQEYLRWTDLEEEGESRGYLERSTTCSRWRHRTLWTVAATFTWLGFVLHLIKILRDRIGVAIVYTETCYKTNSSQTGCRGIVTHNLCTFLCSELKYPVPLLNTYKHNLFSFE